HLYLSSRQISPRMVVFLRYCRQRPRTPLAPSRALERAQVLDGHQRAAMHAVEQQDDIARQVSKRAIASVVPAPAAALLIQERLDAAGVPSVLGMFLREGVALSLEVPDLLVELVDLAAGARLTAIDATGVEEEGTAHLLALPLHLGGGHGGGHGGGGD